MSCLIVLALSLPLGNAGGLADQRSYYEQYLPLDDPRADEFVMEALASAVEFLGKPALPVRKIILRRSTPIDPMSTLRRGFQLTELVDAERGVFAIYLSRKPDEYAFHGQLAHEAGHLLNALLYDCYVEGLNTVFAERFLKKKGLDWSGWERYLRDGSDPFYGATYLMMKEVLAAAGEEYVKTMLPFAVYTDKEKARMHLDINAWLASLPEERRRKVRDAILQHAPRVKQAVALGKNPSAFVLPR